MKTEDLKRLSEQIETAGSSSLCYKAAKELLAEVIRVKETLHPAMDVHELLIDPKDDKELPVAQMRALMKLFLRKYSVPQVLTYLALEIETKETSE